MKSDLASLVASMKSKRQGPPSSSGGGGGGFGPARPPGFGPARPPGFGPARPPPATEHAERREEKEEDGAEEGPALPPPEDGAPPEDEEEEAEEEESLKELIPVSHEAVIRQHGRVVSCLALDVAGSRFATGSFDYNVKLFDFGGMNKEMRPFRGMEPHEGHPIKAISWSPTGDCFLVVDGSSQPKLYDREARELGEFVRGDMYIRDLRNTKGHTSSCTSGQWHPTDKSTCVTASEDGTLRIWDTFEVRQRTVIKPSVSRPGRVIVTACAYNTDGTQIAGALEDGSVQLWDVRGSRVGASAAVGAVPVPRQQMVEKQDWTYMQGTGQWNKTGHKEGTGASGLVFSMDGITLVSRGLDHTVKLWDLRNFTKAPLKVFPNLPNTYETTQITFSPDERFLLTGTSAPEKPRDGESAGGSLVFIDRQKLSIVKRMGTPQSVVAVTWHPALNQIFAGGGDRHQGEVRLMYDPERSKKGALLCVNRQPRKADPTDWEEPLNIVVPGMERGPKRTKRKLVEERLEKERKSHRPDPGQALPVPGRGGRIGTSQSSLLTQHLLQKAEGKLFRDVTVDPREAILRHAEAAEKDPMYSRGYEKTQPKPIFYQEDEEEDEK